VNESDRYSEDLYRSIIVMFDADDSGKLGMVEFRAFFEEFKKWQVTNAGCYFHLVS
jgi:hypothetical protein